MYSKWNQTRCRQREKEHEKRRKIGVKVAKREYKNERGGRCRDRGWRRETEKDGFLSFFFFPSRESAEASIQSRTSVG